MKPTLAFERKLCAALEADDFDGVLSALNSVTRHLDNDPKARQVLGVSSIIMGPDQGLAARLIAAHLAERPPDRLAWTKALLGHAQSTVRGIGVMILPNLYTYRPSFVAAQLMRFADDDNWIMREHAGNAAGRVLNEHFCEFYSMLERWTQHSSENVRRAVVIATMSAFDRERPQPERTEPLLKLHDALITDRAEYVRVNLGPFAIGAMILRHYPEATLKRLRKWARLKDEAARWNVAMVWTSVGARKYAEAGVELLDQLATDERRFVWRAVASAMVKLARARPEVCRPVIAAWSRDPQRAHVAEVAQKYLA
jgi:3-methyladenine DNA glycosylase AlkC